MSKGIRTMKVRLPKKAAVVTALAFVALTSVGIPEVGAKSRLRQIPTVHEVIQAEEKNANDTMPFMWDGVEYESQKAFINSGRRCGTHISEDMIEAVEQEIANKGVE